MRLLRQIAVACLCLMPLGASVQQGRPAAPAKTIAASKVQLTRDGKTIALPYVRAARFLPVEGPPRLHLLFATVAQTDVVLVNSFGEDPASINRWAVLHEEVAAVVSMTVGEEQNYMVMLAAGSSSSAAGGTRMDGEMRGAFRKLQVTDERITGEIMLDEPGRLSGTFDVAVETTREIPFTTGPHVAKSVQAIVLVAYARAMSNLDLKAAQALSASNVEQEFNAARQELGAKYVVQMIAERYGDIAQFEEDLASADASLRESGDTAQIRIQRDVKSPFPEVRTQTFNFVRLNGMWKVR